MALLSLKVRVPERGTPPVNREQTHMEHRRPRRMLWRRPAATLGG